MSYYLFSHLIPICNPDIINKLIDANLALEYMPLIISNKVTAGVYNIMPLGILISNKIKTIIRKHNDKLGSELLFSTLIPLDLYHKSQRNKEFHQEIFSTLNNMCLQATSEESAAISIIQDQTSYKYFPKYFYQISKKFRNEIRPRNNIIRCLEFEMKDGYSFHTNQSCALSYYQTVKLVYCDILNELGIEYKIIDADTASMLASSSEEFIYPDEEVVETRDVVNGIEIGHIFYLGTRYSESMSLRYTDKDNTLKHIHMCSYGIGIYRLIYIYVKQLIHKSLKSELFIFDICFLYRDYEDEMYKTMLLFKDQNKHNILDMDIINIKYKDRLSIVKKLPVKYIIYEADSNYYLFNNTNLKTQAITKDDIYDTIMLITS